MTQALQLATSRLQICGISQINPEELHRYYAENFDHLRAAGGFVPHSPDEVDANRDRWLKGIQAQQEVRFFIKHQQQLIGVVGVTNIVRGAFHAAYLGYHLAQAYEGQGLMTEALEEIIAFSFSGLNLHRLMANYRPDNLASARVLEKLGFEKEGFAKDYLLVDGVWRDHVLTAKTNPNFQLRA